MNDLKVFKSQEFEDVSVIVVDNKEYFEATKVAKAIGYKNTRKAIIDHCLEDGVTNHYIKINSGKKSDGSDVIRSIRKKFIDEGNLYRLILKSQLPSTKEIERWVLDEVLPSIRKYGTYMDKEILNNVLNNLELDEENHIGKFKLLYEQNVGIINLVVKTWLIQLSKSIDYKLFERAIEIATDKVYCNKGYINGIIKQWKDKNIKNINELISYEKGIKNRGSVNHGGYKSEHSKSKYAQALEREDEGLYQKPTEEELESVRFEFEKFKEERVQV